MRQLALIALLIEWVLVITIALPLIIQSSRFSRRFPRLAITVWLISIIMCGAACVFAFELAFESVLNFWSFLSQQRPNPQKTIWAFALSFAPWLLLALGGISIALVNQTLEPLWQHRKSLASALENLSMTRVSVNVESFAVFEIDLDSPIAFAQVIAGKSRIVVSKGLRRKLSEPEFEAVIFHENCHLRQRHQLIKSIAHVIFRLSPRLVASRVLVSEVEVLCEYAADDFVCRKGKKSNLLNALLKMQSKDQLVGLRILRLEKRQAMGNH